VCVCVCVSVCLSVFLSDSLQVLYITNCTYFRPGRNDGFESIPGLGEVRGESYEQQIGHRDERPVDFLPTVTGGKNILFQNQITP